MKRNHDIIELAVVIQHRTDKAVLVENLKGEKVWLPLSMVECDAESGPAEIQLPEWLAEEKELL